MPANRAFERAIRSLSHPVTIAAIGLLLLNDHWLRWVSPSWLTGKLGDVAWLVFAPFIAAFILAWMIPLRWKRQEQLVGLLAVGVIGGWFALAKTVPVAHEITTRVWESLIGWPGSQRMDVTDLLALPALLISWGIWGSAENQPQQRSSLVPVLLALGIVATLASDGPVYYWQDSGITQICQTETVLVTATEAEPRAEYESGSLSRADPDHPTTITPRSHVFRSTDGGLTWAYKLEENYEFPQKGCSNLDVQLAIDPNNAAVQYRWQPGDKIERSTDGGQSWTLDYELIEMQQDARRYYNHFSNSTPSLGGYSRIFIPGPVSGLVEARTGNLVLAMSWDGILLRTASDQQWQWIAVSDQYKLVGLQGFSQLTSMLFFELWLAGALAFLVVTTSTAYMRQRLIGWWRRFLLGFGWLSWLLLIGLLPGSKGLATIDMDIPYFSIGIISLPLLLFLALPLSIGAVWDIARNFRTVWKAIAGMAFGCGLLYLLPLIIWTQGTIPRYATALIFAIGLAFSGLIAGYRYLKKVLPVLENSAADDPKRVIQRKSRWERHQRHIAADNAAASDEDQGASEL